MPVPAIIRAEFEYINPETTQESDYYSAYNILLGHTFPVVDNETVDLDLDSDNTRLHWVISGPITGSCRCHMPSCPTICAI